MQTPRSKHAPACRCILSLNGIAGKKLFQAMKVIEIMSPACRCLLTACARVQKRLLPYLPHFHLRRLSKTQASGDCIRAAGPLETVFAFSPEAVERIIVQAGVNLCNDFRHICTQQTEHANAKRNMHRCWEHANAKRQTPNGSYMQTCKHLSRLLL